MFTRHDPWKALSDEGLKLRGRRQKTAPRDRLAGAALPFAIALFIGNVVSVLILP
jgi:hypothetical protein